MRRIVKKKKGATKMIEMPEFTNKYTAQQISDITGISKRTIERWRRSGIPGNMEGMKYQYLLTKLLLTGNKEIIIKGE
ncbi:hypothetical protein [Capybara microvirus Cap1_SP_175]|nr:hypothetical protein [Capybara microvirus Cap1_SP_175]